MTGLTYLNNRYYDPTVGVFTSVDPLVGKTGTPYLYAAGNPTTLSDPSGLCATFGAADGQHGGSYDDGKGPCAGDSEPDGYPGTIDVPKRETKWHPTGGESAACQHSGAAADVNCFSGRGGTNGNGATQEPAPEGSPVEISDYYTKLIGTWCATHIEGCIGQLLQGAADLYAEHDIQKRHQLNADANSFARGLIRHTDEISCSGGSFGMTVCVGGDLDLPLVHEPHLRGGTTIGDYSFVSSDVTLDDDLLWHESIHSWQWAAASQRSYGVATYAALYTLAGTSGIENLLEQQAGLCEGRYKEC
ncbi:MAG: hypothetical protein F2681_16705 [Actinobacteria bacterium]|uniref:Unannotated protein n=1 Tax=freshwater metagenome TaxID=449393 RepID=A0A6J7C3Z4_9ZZZZ|nr:hypothetical protein [Actinomycetota bacterium]MSW79119.1 hypothetical protein [Actinomycetota bacterium]MSX56119.1 hypothetical protein [Actinomycetota bacterium]MSX93852.1 hypothetical protein [Actinomycetota bacterium]MSZ84773.1 hypothetical protein [Actinomycetota bacterium]